LLLHGNDESVQSFKNQIETLSNSFHVIAMDSRGQGRSTEDGREMTYELMAEDVNAFLDSLHIRSVNIIGWSDGGNIGLILAITRPDRVKSLAIMGANLYNDNTSIEPEINQGFKDELQNLLELSDKETKFRIKLIKMVLTQPNINPDSLRKIVCPTLVMAGSRDAVKEEHTKLIASKIPNSKLVIFSNGTHFEPAKNPERFNKTITEFLRALK
jgi:pimeloyl-ACP methyl ester carboxylesterase